MFPSDHDRHIHSKYSVTLLGSPTRILVENELVTAVVQPKDNFEVMRGKYAIRLEGQPMVGVGKGEIVRFTWGRRDSPVHSEPDMDGDRVFVSVLFGSEAEVRIMIRWRDEVFVEM